MQEPTLGAGGSFEARPPMAQYSPVAQALVGDGCGARGARECPLEADADAAGSALAAGAPTRRARVAVFATVGALALVVAGALAALGRTDHTRWHRDDGSPRHIIVAAEDKQASPRHVGTPLAEIANLVEQHANATFQEDLSKASENDSSSLAPHEYEATFQEDLSKASENDSSSLAPHEYEDQEDAEIEAGGEVKVYAVGSSNVVWMTWIDQLHMYLERLGYKLPPVDAKVKGDPIRVPDCDDSSYFEHLKTTRLGKVGWNSWDFAFDDWDDCDEDGWRNVSGHSVKCEHGVMCQDGRHPLLKLSDIARDAAKSNVVLITTWFNDHKAFTTNPPFKCFRGEKIQQENTSLIAIPDLITTVRAIHKENNKTWVLIMGEYPITQNYRVMQSSVAWVREVNRRVRLELEKEPRTLFVDYHMPSEVETYQKANWGHPNCRGSKLMAHAVMKRLYEGKVIARSYKLVGGLDNQTKSNCHELADAACHTSIMCWKPPENRTCMPYGVGSQHWHIVKP